MSEKPKGLSSLIHEVMKGAPPGDVFTPDWIREEVERRFPDELAAAYERLVDSGWNAHVTKAMKDAQVEDEQLALFEGIPAVITVGPRQWKRAEDTTDADHEIQERYMVENFEKCGGKLERFRAFRATFAPILKKHPEMTVREALLLLD